MSFIRKCKSQNNIFLKHSSILEDVKDVLLMKFGCLNINQTVSQNDVPFLHVWKPITQTEGTQGMPFLPCFHIIVTVSGNDDNDMLHNQAKKSDDGIDVLFQLHSFHGKVIADESIAFEKYKSGEQYDLVQRMAEDRIQICRGIDEVNKDKFTNFLASCELPLLGKIKSVFLIEQLMGEVILRSRLCEFALYSDDNEKGRIDHTRCRECDAFQDRSLDLVQSNQNGVSNSYDANSVAENQKNICDINESNIPYERVFHQTTLSDGQVMEVYDKARYLYEFSKNEVFHSVKKAKRKRKKIVNENKLQVFYDKFEVKTEPSENLDNEQRLLEIYDSQPICDSTSSINIDHDIPSKINTMNECTNFQQNIINKNKTDSVCTEEYSNKLESESVDNNLRPLTKTLEDSTDFSLTLDQIIPQKISKRKYKRKRNLNEEKISHLEKINSQKVDARKRNVTYSRTCRICSHTFTNITHFDQDQTRHTQALSDLNQPFSCPVCNVLIENKFLVTEHFDTIHSDLNVTCCCECSQLIPNGNNRLRRHILKFHHSAEEKVVCPECGKESSGRTQLEIHLAQYHSDKKIAVCQTCGKGFGTMSHYQLHLRRHHQPRDLQCPHCDKKFESRDQAIKHLIVHTGIKPFKCIQCQYVSYRASNVYCVHYEKSHGRKGSQDDVVTDIVERDRMFEIARLEAEKMMEERNSKLKNEPQPESILMG